MEEPRNVFGYGTKFFVITTCLVVIFAAVHAAQSLIAPFLLALFFAMVLMPPLRWLKKQGLSDGIAILALSMVVFLFGLGVIGILSSSLNSFVGRLPAYQKKISVLLSSADQWIDVGKQKFRNMEESFKESVPQIIPQSEPSPPTSESETTDDSTESAAPTSIPTIGPSLEPDSEQPITKRIRSADIRSGSTLSYLSLRKMIDLETVTNYIKSLAQEMMNVASYSFLIAVMVVFMLIEAAKMPAKIAAAFPDHALSDEYFRKIADDTWNYTRIKTYISLLTGIATTFGLWVLGVEYSLLWGLLIFFMNFIPNIGPIIASVPPVLLALIDQGMTGACFVTAYLVFINWAIGYGIEPRYLGAGLGISELVVLLSLIFWGWLLGPIGMFLSAPLTMVCKIVLQNNPSTRWIATLLSNHTDGAKRLQTP